MLLSVTAALEFVALLGIITFSSLKSSKSVSRDLDADMHCVVFL